MPPQKLKRTNKLLSKAQIMAPQFVRGNQLIATEHPPACIAQDFYMPSDGPRHEQVRGGDKLTVAKRTSNGWLRVKNARNGRVTSLRAGPWLALAKDVKLAVDCGGQGSEIDLMIRKSQIDKLNAALEEQTAAVEAWQNSYQELHKQSVQETLDSENRIQELSDYIANLQQELTCYSGALQAAQARIKELEGFGSSWSPLPPPSPQESFSH
jgi:hypothetical protein